MTTISGKQGERFLKNMIKNEKKYKYKVIRIKLSTWRELRHLFPGKRGESIADYLDRFMDYQIINSEVEQLDKLNKSLKFGDYLLR